jgi:acetate CoA/acetoacetate CoA-transferase beta subunit
MGGAMDLVAGAVRVIVAMQHTTRGQSKIVPKLTLPPTSMRAVSLVVTDLAVLHPTADGLVLQERAPGVSVKDIIDATAAPFIVPDEVPEMRIVGAGAIAGDPVSTC